MYNSMSSTKTAGGQILLELSLAAGGSSCIRAFQRMGQSQPPLTLRSQTQVPVKSGFQWFLTSLCSWAADLLFCQGALLSPSLQVLQRTSSVDRGVLSTPRCSQKKRSDVVTWGVVWINRQLCTQLPHRNGHNFWA